MNLQRMFPSDISEMPHWSLLCCSWRTIVVLSTVALMALMHLNVEETFTFRLQRRIGCAGKENVCTRTSELHLQPDFSSLCNFLFSLRILRKIYILANTEHEFISNTVYSDIARVSAMECLFFHLWNNLIPPHLKMTHQSTGRLESHVLNSQNKYEAGHNQEMPAVLPRYQIHAFPSEQHDCSVNPTSIFYVTEDTTHVLCP